MKGERFRLNKKRYLRSTRGRKLNKRKKERHITRGEAMKKRI